MSDKRKNTEFVEGDNKFGKFPSISWPRLLFPKELSLVHSMTDSRDRVADGAKKYP